MTRRSRKNQDDEVVVDDDNDAAVGTAEVVYYQQLNRNQQDLIILDDTTLAMIKEFGPELGLSKLDKDYAIQVKWVNGDVKGNLSASLIKYRSVSQSRAKRKRKQTVPVNCTPSAAAAKRPARTVTPSIGSPLPKKKINKAGTNSTAKGEKGGVKHKKKMRGKSPVLDFEKIHQQIVPSNNNEVDMNLFHDKMVGTFARVHGINFTRVVPVPGANGSVNSKTITCSLNKSALVNCKDGKALYEMGRANDQYGVFKWDDDTYDKLTTGDIPEYDVQYEFFQQEYIRERFFNLEISDVLIGNDPTVQIKVSVVKISPVGTTGRSITY